MAIIAGKAGQDLRGSVPVGKVLFLNDALAWVAALFIGVVLRYEFNLGSINWAAYVGFAIAAVLLQFVLGLVLHLYRKGLRYPFGSFEDTLNVSISVIVVGVVLWVASMFLGMRLGISRGVMLLVIPLALVMVLSIRYLARMRVERLRRPAANSTPALILGGGYIGTNLIQWMMSDPKSPFRPVGVIDDNPELAWQRVRGVPVLGTFDDIASVASDTRAELLIVAIGDANSALLRRVQDVANKNGLSVKVMPAIDRVVSKGVRGNDLRDLSIEDLLGRQPVETNVSEITGYLTGKRVLVTGAGGSIGSQLCTEIAKYGPSELIMLDRDETGLQQVLINVAGNGLLDTDAVVLADIREADALKELFLKRCPEVVFHAAALKHLPMLEQYPDEGWKTNVLGTLNVLAAAEAVNVETFVNISTDKAANPTSVLGHSKRVAEKLTAWYGQNSSSKYLSVRFGNVIGSRGSMLPTFTRLIMEDKPLTVTHPDVTRFFMTIPEACQLVLQAGGIGRSGEVLILDMGEPVSILEIAQRMIAMSGKDIDIVFTGLREGEKMHEELVGDGETEDRPFHSKISHAHAESLAPNNLDRDRFMQRAGKQNSIDSEII
ncbi:dTDP-glucose 4,6-dehydratase transmembrane protein [Corynebacterium glutamicum MT]|uniref:Polysaccharide biosynthesis protein n=1 Tax=Corynebacterium glutamicum TaxID=1718 RepID=A0AB36I4V9_CORGT|nr:nucleoside-diphosphate sugar epimerase/dehydratase [Corynebacterium glutamicum]AGN21043.1 dTDP-glucose 4,6-dehydratase transmembrane protein [Corynebacterium glutamicum SCgG2]EGV40946.1 dTDP-glucose 4,6-dehydratase transmembrane protein [Corynebacterium glutamicum S9114]EOA64246.1 dTDP-glucose 4,6-dehydratase transmembrane protein [Corynebacterium glutamicum MT]EPP41762.1 dTDP-glucose 4,6-dehydratase transmembrane protein [Corynebacterium glutamicum Z188]NII88516.1 dTDP-glucose 4,6-dehydrat